MSSEDSETSEDAMAQKVEVHADKPYDEAIEIAGSDDGVSTPSSNLASRTVKKSPPRPAQPDESDSDNTEPSQPRRKPQSDSDSESSSDDSDSNSNKADLPAGAYNPADYENLKVSPEIQELFQYIGRYKPHTIDVDVRLKPFIPEYIPAIGEVDAFLKIPRVDGKRDGLGLTRLDEPCLNPSDPTVLDLQLRSISKHANLQPMNVNGLEGGEKNPKEIKNWIDRIQELHRNKPAPTVQYVRKMPDIENLMQVWPQEFEEYLTNNPLPGLGSLDDVDLKDYIKVIATILDIPVYTQTTDSLHTIFTLYSEFKSNQHFANQEQLVRNDVTYAMETQMPPTSRAPSRQSEINGMA
eukprot:GEMP01056002.1.p1 GENE.GEMP01056002.1~~GEMP01056002.1.p1  ORF type:complete len:353 (+),score=76.60 GEMP01056002.1:75-1133(+)